MINEETLEKQIPKKPFYKRHSWRVGPSKYAKWDVPFCGNCKQQLGLIAKAMKEVKCPFCGCEINWSEE